MNHRILIAGSRDWTDIDTIKHIMVNETLIAKNLNELLTLIHGTARGVDSIAAKIAAQHNWTIEAYPAEWSKYGRSAGFKRNLQMIQANPTHAYIFWNGKSKGTAHTISLCEKHNIPHDVILENT